MSIELLGIRVQIARPHFAVRHPVVDRPLAACSGQIVADRRRAILAVTGVGTFAIEEGQRICFQPEAETTEGALSMWLHGTVSALLLGQRGQFALHASVVAVNGRGIAIAGIQRAGKSTAALRLAQQGHALVTDDVSPVLTGGQVTVTPYTRPVYVHPDTASKLNLDLSRARPVLPEHPKLALPPARHDPVPLAAVAVIEKSEAAVDVASMRARGSRAQWLISRNVYRIGLVGELWPGELFLWASELANRVGVYRVVRPLDGWTVDLVAREVEGIGLSGTRTGP